MHTHPTEGEPQYVAKHVVDLLFPPGTPARIPIVAVTGSNGKTTTTRMIAHIFRGMGRQVGVTSTDGIYIDERLVKRVDASGPEVRADGAAEPARRHGGLRDRARRDPARGPGLRAQRRRCRAERHGRPPGAQGDRHAGAAGCREAGRRGSRAAERLRRVERRRSARPGDAPSLRRERDPVHHGREARPRRTMGSARTQGGRPRAERPRRDDGDQGRPPHHAHRLDPHAAVDLRRQGAHDGAERHGGRRGGARRGRAPARHPAGPAFVHDVRVPGARPPEPVRPRRGAG